MASAAAEPRLDAVVSNFVVEHSELYKEQKAGDALATVEGCFPPATLVPTERVAECLRALTGLFAEATAAQPPIGDRRWTRIFHVRASSLYESLEAVGTEEGLADVKTVADYMVLPKSLNEALELEAAVVRPGAITGKPPPFTTLRLR